MTKRLSREEKRQQVVVDLINEMFKIAGHDVTYDDIKDRKDNWFQQWSMTMKQADEWKEWGSQHIRKTLKVNKHLADKEMLWVNLQWGLTYSDWPHEKKD